MLALLVWVYALSLSLPPLFNWGRYGPEAYNISCSVSWEVRDPETHNDTYIAFIFILGFFLPLVLISGSYCGVIRILRNAKKRISEFVLLVRHEIVSYYDFFPPPFLLIIIIVML